MTVFDDIVLTLKSEKEMMQLLNLFLAYHLYWDRVADNKPKIGYDAIPNPPEYLINKK